MKYPGLEFAFNCLYELLLGKEVMYPVKYLKMSGRNSSADGKDCYYSASTKFGTNNLSLIIDAPGAFAGNSTDFINLSTFRLCETEFSVLFLTSLLFKATNIKFENIVAEKSPHQSIISLFGVIMDDYMVAGLFQGGQGRSSKGSTNGVNALYLSSQMDEAVSQLLCEVLTSFPTSEYLLSTWIRELFLQNKRYGHLKAAGFSSSDFDLLHIPMQLPQGIISSMNETLKEVRKVLLISNNEASTIPTHSDLLSRFHPELADFYALKRSCYKTSSSCTSEQTQGLDEMRVIYEELLSESLKKINTYLINTDENIEIDQVAIELLNSTDFVDWTFVVDGDEDDGLKSFFQNLSFLSSITLNRISLNQLRSVFCDMIASLKSSTKLQEQLLTWQAQGTLSLKANASANINVKQIIFSGLEPSMVKELLESDVVMDLKAYFGIKVLVN